MGQIETAEEFLDNDRKETPSLPEAEMMVDLHQSCARTLQDLINARDGGADRESLDHFVLEVEAVESRMPQPLHMYKKDEISNMIDGAEEYRKEHQDHASWWEDVVVEIRRRG